MRLIIEENHNPAHNLAREEALLNNLKEDVVYLWCNQPSVIVGRNQDTFMEIDKTIVEERGIQVVRRITGGGAVYQDLGNINFSYLFTVDDDKGFETFVDIGVKIILDFLEENGIKAFPSGKNDICVVSGTDGEQKISGTATIQRGSKGIFHSTLLYDCSVDIMEAVLTPDKEKLISKGIDSVKARVTNIKGMLNANQISRKEFILNWVEFIKKDYNGRISGVTIAEEKETKRLTIEKYYCRQWNFGDPFAERRRRNEI